MIRKRISNILLKEWQVLLTDTNSVLIITLLPLLIVGQLLLYIWLAVTFGGETVTEFQVFVNAIDNLKKAIPAILSFTEVEQFLLLLLTQFNFFLLLIPTMIAINFSTFSIVEEKISGSLEALLATPVRTWELLLGKTLAGAIPALLVTWICAGIYILAVKLMGWGHLIEYVVNPSWFISLFLLTPAIAIMSFMLGVIGSSRAKDSRSAQNIVLVIIFPVLALIAIQITGVIWFDTVLILILGLVICILDYFILRLAVHLFQRESIIVQWH